MISVIVPVYNEADLLDRCLVSLSAQTNRNFEVIIVDDGSDEKIKINGQGSKKTKTRIFTQKHQGPAKARNLGASHAEGEILVFADADMTFAKDYLDKLTGPIRSKESKGTFTREEYVSNWENVWARCWNYNQGIREKRRIPIDYPHTSPVFRAILREEFEKVNGFDDIGFTDDWTLSRKLGYQASEAPGAACYHQNPSALREVYHQARWIGKNEFISGSLVRRFVNLLRQNIFTQLVRSFYIAAIYQEIRYPLFSLFYYWGITLSIILSFFGEPKYK